MKPTQVVYLYYMMGGIDGTGTGDRPFRPGPVRYRSGFRTGRSTVRPVIRRSTGRLPFDRLDRSIAVRTAICRLIG